MATHLWCQLCTLWYLGKDRGHTPVVSTVYVMISGLRSWPHACGVNCVRYDIWVKIVATRLWCQLCTLWYLGKDRGHTPVVSTVYVMISGLRSWPHACGVNCVRYDIWVKIVATRLWCQLCTLWYLGKDRGHTPVVSTVYVMISGLRSWPHACGVNCVRYDIWVKIVATHLWCQLCTLWYLGKDRGHTPVVSTVYVMISG